MIWVLLPLENLVHLGNWFCAQRERTQPFGWLAGGRREGVHYPQHHLNRGAQSAGRTSDPSDLQPPEQFNGAGRSERNCWSYDDTVESFGIHEQVDTLLATCQTPLKHPTCRSRCRSKWCDDMAFLSARNHSNPPSSYPRLVPSCELCRSPAPPNINGRVIQSATG